MFPPDLIARATALIARYRAAGLMVATAESCTGGLIAGLLTEIPGSSTVLERGFVVYSNAAKQELLGVPAETLADYGAVSEHTARAMAEGALRASRAEVAVSVTGIAGPDGGTAAKPVGLVHFACARRGGPTVARQERFGDIGREAVRLASVRVGLDLLEAAAGESAIHNAWVRVSQFKSDDEPSRGLRLRKVHGPVEERAADLMIVITLGGRA